MNSILNSYLKYIPEEEKQNFLNAVAHDTVNSLNKAIECDSQAVASLFGMRVICNLAMGNSDILIVDHVNVGQMSVSGLLNGILCKGTVNIMPIYDTHGRLSMFMPVRKDDQSKTQTSKESDDGKN